MVRAAVDHISQWPDSPLHLINFLAYTEQELAVFREVLRSAPVDPVGD